MDNHTFDKDLMMFVADTDRDDVLPTSLDLTIHLSPEDVDRLEALTDYYDKTPEEVFLIAFRQGYLDTLLGR